MKKLFAAVFLLASFVALPASAGNWSVDYTKSKLGFTVQWSGEPFTASFKSWKADIDFDPADLAHAKAAVTVDLGSEDSGQSDFDSGIKGAFGFSTQQFPAAHFTTTGFTHKAGNNYVATGTLSLHGVTKPVTVPFMLTITGKTAHMTASTQVMRTDFGIGEGEWAGETPVAHAVTVNIDLTATRN